MSLILRLACVRYLRRTPVRIARPYSVNHAPAIPDWCRIRYFIPRTMNTSKNQTEITPGKESYGANQEYELIYKFSEERLFHFVSYSVLGSILFCTYLLFNPQLIFPPGNLKGEEDNHDSEELRVQKNEIHIFKDFYLDLEDPFVRSIYCGDVKIKIGVVVILASIIFYLQSKSVLKIYRYKDKYVTVFFRPIGFHNKLIEHRSTDCHCYPNKKLFQYKLFGQNIIVFPEHFTSEKERCLYSKEGWNQ